MISRNRSSVVSTGLDVLLEERSQELKGLRIGLLAHPASVDGELRSTLQRLQERSDVRLTALFGPEHGLHTGAQDMVAVAEDHDRSSGLRIHSLYGETEASLSPTPESLEDVDLLIADLQDVGARYYTFAATAALALEALAPRRKRLLVLDRPNPIGGLSIEGPPLEERMRSFVGHIRTPIRHGLTMGELLLYHAREAGLTPALEVVPMRGWSRSMSFEDTDLPWVPPSPNMPTIETAYVYPGACLIEATNLSEGRGTTRPFEWIGAPFLDPERYASALNAETLPGVTFRPMTFVPGFQKWSGRVCGGVALHVTDRSRFQPVRTGAALLIHARRLAPALFAWRSEPYEFVTDRPAIDLLTGSTRFREAIEGGGGLEDVTAHWTESEDAWARSRSAHLLYP